MRDTIKRFFRRLFKKEIEPAIGICNIPSRYLEGYCSLEYTPNKNIDNT